VAAGDVTLTRGVGFRDDFLTTTAWTVDVGATLTTDGDIATLSTTGLNNGITETVTGSLSSTSYPNLIIRLALGAGGSSQLLHVTVTYTDASTSVFDIATGGTVNSWSTATNTLTAGKTISTIKLAGNIVGSITFKLDFHFFFKETLTLPSVSQPLQFSLPRYIVELPIPTREGGILQDLGSQSAQIEVAGTLITTTTPNNYTGDQWWDVLVGTWLEANWQWIVSDRVSYKYQIMEFTGKQDPGRVGYYDFKLRLKKVDVVSARADSYGSATGSGLGAIQ
jgi:hypothetical protein